MELQIRVYGEKGGLEWHQHEPNTLLVKWLDQPAQILSAGAIMAIVYQVLQHIIAEHQAVILKVILKHLEISIRILHLTLSCKIEW